MDDHQEQQAGKGNSHHSLSSNSGTSFPRMQCQLIRRHSKKTCITCDKYNSVFAPGTLGILPDTYLVPVTVSNGLGDRHIKNATMGFINVTERNHWMTLNTAFIHINTSINSIHHITAHSR